MSESEISEPQLLRFISYTGKLSARAIELNIWRFLDEHWENFSLLKNFCGDSYRLHAVAMRTEHDLFTIGFALR